MEAQPLATTADAVQSAGEDEEHAPKHKVPLMADLEKPSMEPLSLASASSTWKEEDHEHEQRLKMAKGEMREVKEENQRLKRCLDEMMRDYESLKRQFHDMSTINNEAAEEVEDMVSLTLGRSSTDQNKNTCPETKPDLQNIQSPADSEQGKEEDAGQTWPPGKVLKGLAAPPAGEDEVSQQNPPKKTRVCVRARCDTPTLNDGCHWRKYGQKIAKGNPCPRAYYRCTGAPSCPVRKQVQRSVDDISILITTYEGTHNHPLPVSAMAMASTTSAAASMLLSGASTSTSRPGLNPSAIGTASANLHGMNMYTNSKQFYLSNSSMLSSSLNHPTITLDLTSNPPSASSSSSSSSFHKIPSTYPPKYPFTSLDFGSWNTNINKNVLGMSSDLAKQFPPHSNIYQACLQQFAKPSTPPPLPLPDTIAAATKAITSDPSFQSALAAALSSIIGGGNGGEAVQAMSSYVQAAQGQGSMGFQAAPSLTYSTSKSPSSPGDSRDDDTK
ncbi:probable WRKY transcription factor 72 [Cucurbita pepo subsp. pepo]|uniref:probable WRKY transcription factor 72 n=1 Tax=Cucurbita pepo subsp. pepo TaxID=3664 RepID=UPI000C9D8243|nr:probable WRKY transcription factor 72 [Cucurbita pepo subsp. pepo]